MIVHPELRALRRDASAQRRAQEALIRRVEDWRAQPGIAEVLAELDRFGAGAALADCPALAAMFEDGNPAAGAFAGDLACMAAQGLGEEPLGHVPFRHFTDGVFSTLLIARTGNATLSLIAVDGEGFVARPAPVTVDFSPSEIWEHVLAGRGVAQLVERSGPLEGPALLDRRDIALQPGNVVCRSPCVQTMLLRGVESCLVTLRLQRRLPKAGPTREYRLADGVLVHQAAGDVRDSRIEMMMALLGRMQRSDAAPLFSAIAREEGSMALRWQALRECLALDTRTGFAALTAIARSLDDELAPMAGALRSQLIETYPQLVKIEACLE